MTLREIDLPINEVLFWTDSSCLLAYISNQERRFKTFVANKIALIQETAQPSQWKYVNTQLNVADDISRGLSAEALINNTRWKKGPDFLWKTEDHWPEQPMSHATLDCRDPELRKEAKTFTAPAGNNADVIDQIIQYFSSWFKLKKHIAWILRYCSKLLSASQKTRRKQEIIFSTERPMPIAAEEIQCAEIEIVKYVQSRCFAGEVSSSNSSKLHKLNAFRVNGL